MDEKYRENFHDFLAIPLIHETILFRSAYSSGSAHRDYVFRGRHTKF